MDFRVGIPGEKCFGAYRVRPSENLRLLGELRQLSLTVAMRMCVSPPPGDRERGPGPGAAPQDPGASPGGVKLVMSPGLALRKPGSTRAGLSTHRLGPDDPRQPDPRPIPSRLGRLRENVS